MKYFILNLFNQFQEFSQKLDEKALVRNFNWVNVNEIKDQKKVYFFRPDNKLLIVLNGIVESTGTWEFIGAGNLLISYGDVTYFLKHTFVDDMILVLRRDGTEEYAVFVNESKYGNELNGIDDVQKFLTSKYGTVIQEEHRSKLFLEIRNQNPLLSLSEIYHLLERRLKSEGW